MTSWQPIETAPRDGTIILLYEPSEFDLPEQFVFGEWSGTGFVESFNHEYAIISPSHWMPKPEAP